MNDRWHKAQYERVLLGANAEGPPWEDLTEEQRENIRKANNDHARFMDDLGKAIATGGPLPNPFGGRK